MEFSPEFLKAVANVGVSVFIAVFLVIYITKKIARNIEKIRMLQREQGKAIKELRDILDRSAVIEARLTVEEIIRFAYALARVPVNTIQLTPVVELIHSELEQAASALQSAWRKLRDQGDPDLLKLTVPLTKALFLAQLWREIER